MALSAPATTNDLKLDTIESVASEIINKIATSSKHEGEVTLKTGIYHFDAEKCDSHYLRNITTVGGVTFEYSDDIKKIDEERVKNAISLVAKIKLLEKLANLGDNEIIKRIRVNHFDPNNPQEMKFVINLTPDAVDNTLRQIQRMGTSGIGFFSGSANNTTQQKISKALKEIGVENIRSFTQVNKAIEKITSIGPIKPSAAPRI